MIERNPEEAHRLLAEAMNVGDLDSLTALYESGAKLASEPGQVVTGSKAIREALKGFLELNPQITIETTNVMEAGDIALLRSKWVLTGTGPDGQSIEMAHNGIEVVRRQTDGRWLYIIDNPLGAD